MMQRHSRVHSLGLLRDEDRRWASQRVSNPCHERVVMVDAADIKTISFCIMASLQVRNIPDDLYEALKERANKEGRSLSAQTVAILRRALATSLVDRAGVARRVAARRRSAGVMTRSAQEMVREDRDR